VVAEPIAVRQRTSFAARLALVAFVMTLTGGCAAPRAPVPGTLAPRGDASAVSRVLAYHQTIQPLNAAELARERRQIGEERGAERQMQQALLALHQRGLNLPRARALLEGMLSGQDAEARELHGLARLLLEQVNERMRLDGLNERLGHQIERSNQQLERSAQQLSEGQLQIDALQRKLEALTEIELSLPTRPAAMQPAPPSSLPR
jgi:hypothetical protein